MINPLVSVIVPNYNYAHYLDVRLNSILSQTYPNFEVIILDDSSTDNSVEVINKFKYYPQISKVIINESNSGSPFCQWALGIKESSGDIIWIAESDDICEPFFLESLVDLYLKSNSVLTFCRSILVDENGNKLRENDQMKDVVSDISLDGKSFIKQYLSCSNSVQNASCAIFSKEAAIGVDDCYMKFKGAGDWLFWILIAEKGNVSFVNKALNKYRLHSNTTRKVVKSGVEFHEMKAIYDWLLLNKYINDAQYEKCRISNIYLISSLEEIPTNIKNELYDMWGASFLQKMMIRLRKIKSRFSSLIYA